MRFEWDDQKARENLKKHGVTFGEATEVFYDPNALEVEDTEHLFDETRFSIIGYSTRRILFVVSQNGIVISQDYFGAKTNTDGKEDI